MRITPARLTALLCLSLAACDDGASAGPDLPDAGRCPSISLEIEDNPLVTQEPWVELAGRVEGEGAGEPGLTLVRDGEGRPLNLKDGRFEARLTLSDGAHEIYVALGDCQSEILRVRYEPAPPPRLEAIVPPTAPLEGGVPIVIWGEGIREGAWLELGGVPVEPLTWIDASRLMGTAPASPEPRLVNARIINPDGQSHTLMRAFKWREGPQISQLSPTEGWSAGGESVWIEGSGFDAGAAVTFDGIPATITEVQGAERVICRAPPGLPGPVDVVVRNPDGAEALAEGGYTYLETLNPRLDRALPSRISIHGGARVRIEGSRLDLIENIRFGGVAVDALQRIDAARVEVLAPPGPLGTAEVVGEDRFGEVYTLPRGVEYFEPVPPRVSSLEPTWLRAEGGAVLLSGAEIQARARLTLDGAPVEILEQGAESIHFIAPPRPPGWVTLELLNPDGGRAEPARLLYLDDADPQLDRLEPNQSTLAGEGRARVEGDHIPPGTRFFLGGVEAEGVEIDPPHAATLRIPPVDAPQVVDLLALTPDGRQGALEGALSYLTFIPPTLRSFAPLEAPDTGGAIITLMGAHLPADGVVIFDGVPAIYTRPLDEGRLEAQLPLGLSGPVEISLDAPEGARLTFDAPLNVYPWPGAIEVSHPRASSTPSDEAARLYASALEPREGLSVEIATRPDAGAPWRLWPAAHEGAYWVAEIEGLAEGAYEWSARGSLDGAHWRWAEAAPLPLEIGPPALRVLEIGPLEGPPEGGVLVRLRFEGTPPTALRFDGARVPLEVGEGEAWGLSPARPLRDDPTDAARLTVIDAAERVALTTRFRYRAALVEGALEGPTTVHLGAPAPQYQLVTPLDCEASLSVEGAEGAGPWRPGVYLGEGLWRFTPDLTRLGGYALHARVRCLGDPRLEALPPLGVEVRAAPAASALRLDPSEAPAGFAVGIAITGEGLSPAGRLLLDGRPLAARWEGGAWWAQLPATLAEGEHLLSHRAPDGAEIAATLLLYPRAAAPHLALPPSACDDCDVAPLSARLGAPLDLEIIAPEAARARLRVGEVTHEARLVDAEAGRWRAAWTPQEIGRHALSAEASLDGAHWRAGPSALAFIYRDGGPQLTGFAPQRVPTDAPTWVRLEGAGLEALEAVRFGALEALEIERLSDTRARALAPPQGVGLVEIHAWTPAGRARVGDLFYVDPQLSPSLVDLTVSQGALSPPIEIASEAPVEVGFGDPEAALTWVTAAPLGDGRHAAQIRPLEIGTWALMARAVGDPARPEPETWAQLTVRAPTPLTLTPPAAALQLGGALRLEGGGFDETCVASLGGRPLPTRAWSATHLEVELPPSAEAAPAWLWIGRADGATASVTLPRTPSPLDGWLLTPWLEGARAAVTRLEVYVEGDDPIVEIRLEDRWWPTADLGAGRYALDFTPSDAGRLSFYARAREEGGPWLLIDRGGLHAGEAPGALGALRVYDTPSPQITAVTPARASVGEPMRVDGEGLGAIFFDGIEAPLLEVGEGYVYVAPPEGLRGEVDLWAAQAERLSAPWPVEILLRPPASALAPPFELEGAVGGLGPQARATLAEEGLCVEVGLRGAGGAWAWSPAAVEGVTAHARLPLEAEGLYDFTFRVSYGCEGWRRLTTPEGGLGQLTIHPPASARVTAVAPLTLSPQGGCVFIQGEGLVDGIEAQLDGQPIALERLDEQRARACLPAHAPGEATLRIGEAAVTLTFRAQVIAPALQPQAIEVYVGEPASVRAWSAEGVVEIGYGPAGTSPRGEGWAWWPTTPAEGFYEAILRFERPGEFDVVARATRPEHLTGYSDLNGGVISAQVLPRRAPTLERLLPSEGDAAGGEIVALVGEGILAEDWLRFGADEVPLRLGEAGRYEAVTPAGAPGEVEVTLVHEGGEVGPIRFSRYPFPDALEILERPAPALTTGEALSARVGVTEAGATAAPGATQGLRVQLGYALEGGAEGWRWIDAAFEGDEGEADVYAALTPAPAPGAYHLRWRAALDDVHWRTLEGEGFEIAPPEAPRVFSVTPAEASVEGGALIHIEGEGLEGAVVEFDGVAAWQASASDADLYVLAPPHDEGPATLRVWRGEGATSAPFSYYPLPPSAALRPPAARLICEGEHARVEVEAAGEARVQIGWGLEPDLEGWIWVDAEATASAEAAIIYGATLAPPLGRVYLAGRLSADGLHWRYADLDGWENGYQAAEAGVIEIAPHGQARLDAAAPPFGRGGDRIELRGWHLRPEAVVWFGAQRSPAVEWLSNEALIVEAPEAARAGPVDVRVQLGEGGAARLPEGFRYLRSPAPLHLETPSVTLTIGDPPPSLAARYEDESPMAEVALGYGPRDAHPSDPRWRFFEATALGEGRYVAEITPETGAWATAARIWPAEGPLYAGLTGAYTPEEAGALRVDPRVDAVTPEALVAGEAAALEIEGAGLEGATAWLAEQPLEVTATPGGLLAQVPAQSFTDEGALTAPRSLRVEVRGAEATWPLRLTRPFAEARLLGPLEVESAVGEPPMEILGLARVPGFTEAEGPTPGLEAALGWGDPLAPPSTWAWIEGRYIGEQDGGDLFAALLPIERAGEHAFAWRFSMGVEVYAGAGGAPLRAGEAGRLDALPSDGVEVFAVRPSAGPYDLPMRVQIEGWGLGAAQIALDDRPLLAEPTPEGGLEILLPAREAPGVDLLEIEGAAWPIQRTGRVLGIVEPAEPPPGVVGLAAAPHFAWAEVNAPVEGIQLELGLADGEAWRWIPAEPLGQGWFSAAPTPAESGWLPRAWRAQIGAQGWGAPFEVAPWPAHPRLDALSPTEVEPGGPTWLLGAGFDPNGAARLDGAPRPLVERALTAPPVEAGLARRVEIRAVSADDLHSAPATLLITRPVEGAWRFEAPDALALGEVYRARLGVLIEGAPSEGAPLEGLEVQLGVGPAGADPALSPRWGWSDARWIEAQAGAGIYEAAWSPRQIGRYDVAWRLRLAPEATWRGLEALPRVEALDAPPPTLQVYDNAPLELYHLSPAEAPLGRARVLIEGVGFTPDLEARWGDTLLEIEALHDAQMEVIVDCEAPAAAPLTLARPDGQRRAAAFSCYALPKGRLEQPLELELDLGEVGPLVYGSAEGATHAELCHGPADTHPLHDPGWRCVEASPLGEDRFVARLTPRLQGRLHFAFRFSADGAHWFAADRDGGVYRFEEAGTAWIIAPADGAPLISALEPDEGPIQGGAPSQLTGAGFEPGVRVLFGEAEAEVTRLSSGLLEVRPPAGAAGRVDVRVLGLEGGVALLEAGYLYYPAPSWGNLQWPPDLEQTPGVEGPLVAGRARGMEAGCEAWLGYGPWGVHPEDARWRWVEGRAHDEAAEEGTYEARLQAPSAGEYAYAWRYSCDDGAHWRWGDLNGSGDGYQADQAGRLTVVGAPTLSRIEPGEIDGLGGALVEVWGEGLQPDAWVYLDDTPALEVRFISTQRLWFEAPPMEVSGPVDVWIVNPDEGRAALRGALEIYPVIEACGWGASAPSRGFVGAPLPLGPARVYAPHAEGPEALRAEVLISLEGEARVVEGALVGEARGEQIYEASVTPEGPGWLEYAWRYSLDEGAHWRCDAPPRGVEIYAPPEISEVALGAAAWIELHNPNEAPLSLEGLSLNGAPLEGALAPGACAVLALEAPLDEAGALTLDLEGAPLTRAVICEAGCAAGSWSRGEGGFEPAAPTPGVCSR